MAVKLGRNDPCHCGSGNKYKRCCLEADAAATSAALAAERDRIAAEQGLFDGDWVPDDDGLDDDMDPAPPFAREDVLAVTYKRGVAHDPDQIGLGEGFQVTEWAAPDIPGEILEAFEREAVWELDGWWGDPGLAYPIELDLITIHSRQGDTIIEVENRGAALATGGDIEELESLSRVCSALALAAKRGTGRSWISHEYEYEYEVEEGDSFDDDTGYDPDIGPDPTEWMALSEGERMERVQSWHHARRIALPSPGLHAGVHTTIENQIAEQIPEVLDALHRLRNEGLTRHEAVHAIGMVLSEEIFPVLQGDPGERDLNAAYGERLKRLTADEWRRLAEADGEDEG